MARFVKYDINGTITSFGIKSTKDIESLQKAGVRIAEVSELGRAMDITHRVKDPLSARPILEATGKKPPVFTEKPIDKQPAKITNKQWQEVLRRLEALEKE